MAIIGLYRMLQTWMIDFIYGFDGIYVDDVTRYSTGITVNAQMRDTPTTTKADILVDLVDIKFDRLFKDLSISVDEDEIDITFNSNIDSYIAGLIRKYSDKLRGNNVKIVLTNFLNACHSEITDIANDFSISMGDNFSGNDWETVIHNQLLLVLHDMMKDANIPIGNMIEPYLWEE
jgi:hypothetical protein